MGVDLFGEGAQQPGAVTGGDRAPRREGPVGALSELLSAACADARKRVTDLLDAIPVLQRTIEHAAGQHAAIAEAIPAGDPDAARRAVAEHLEGTGALLRGFLA
nr:FCD domain-containing protein [Actinomadura sp. HBU206391]